MNKTNDAMDTTGRFGTLKGEQRQETGHNDTLVSSTTDEPGIDFVTQRMSLNEDGTEDIDIECRFVDGQKFAAITVDGGFPNLAQRISDFLNSK